MLETRLEEFKSLVGINNRYLLSSIDSVLKEFFPSSSSADTYVVVPDPYVAVEPYCLFGGDEFNQKRVGFTKIKDDNLLIVEKGWEAITRSFKNMEDALAAYNLVGAYFLYEYIKGDNLDIHFEQNLRQVAQLQYKGMPAIFTIYTDRNPKINLEYGVLHTQRDKRQTIYDKSQREHIIRGIRDNTVIPFKPLEDAA